MMKTNTKKKLEKKPLDGIDWGITLAPLLIILVISAALMLVPNQSKKLITVLRSFFVNDLGFFYILLGLGILGLAIWLAFSRFGSIQLGKRERPLYSNFKWGAMIFTSTMAADILYWSLIEWGYYYGASPFAMENMTLAQKQDMASAYPLFHWGPIPWGFYILPAVAYAYMMFVKKRQRQSLSEACRPVLGGRTDRFPGRFIDVFAIVGLLAGTATTFSTATPLLSQALAHLFHTEVTPLLSILVLLVIGVVFSAAVLWGMKAISHLADVCVVIFCLLLDRKSVV